MATASNSRVWAFPLFPRLAPAFSGWRYFHITHSVVSVTFWAHLLLARWPNDRTFLGDTQVNAPYRQHRPASSVCPGCPVTCRQASAQARLSRLGAEEEGSLRACGAAAVTSLTGLAGTSLHSEPLMDYELRGAIVSPESTNPRPTVPSCAVGQPLWNSPIVPPASALHSRLPASWGAFQHNGLGGPQLPRRM